MLFHPECDPCSRSRKLPGLTLVLPLAIALSLVMSACGGGGGGSDNPSNEGDIVVGTVWPQADSNPPGAFDTDLPAAVESVRYVFRSDSGYSCCVVVDPDALSGNRAITLQSVPAGPGTLQVSGYPTSFAGAPEGVTNTCDIDPAIGRACSQNRVSSPSFDTGPRDVDVAGGDSNNVGNVEVRAVPFVILSSLTPPQNGSVNNSFAVGFTVVDAIYGVNPSSIQSALFPNGESRRNLTIVLTACTDGTATPCSANSQLQVSGFIGSADAPQSAPSGNTGIEIQARNLAAQPGSMDFDYNFSVGAPVATATAPRSATPTVRTPTNTVVLRTATPTATRTQPVTFTPSVTRTPREVSLVFVRGTSFTLSQEPSYMAVGDFNRDNRDDVAVVSPESNEINILLGNNDGSFTPGTVANFGNFPGFVAAGNINNDTFIDLAIADERAGGVFLMYGGPGATFTAPALRQVGRRPFGVAIADFDHATGNDLVISDRDTNRVQVLLNNGAAAPIFSLGGTTQVGTEPTDIVTADFNLDNNVDVATLNSGGSAVKDVTLLYFNRVVDNTVVFNRVANLVVGERPLDLSVAEFNRDGRPDLVMVNRPANDGFGEIYYMLSRPDGVMTQSEPLVVHCPDRSVNCRARALAVGDFDADGISDVAITLNQAGQGQETDVMRIFVGTGDGGFIPGPTIPTEGQPLAMATGDFTGDGVTDIIVSSAQTDGVQVYINVSGQN